MDIVISIKSLFDPLLQFMAQGGSVLWWLALIVFISWYLVIEKVWFLVFVYPDEKAYWVERWQQRDDHQSWYARNIRDAWLSQAHQRLFKNMNFIKVLVSLCPMLGLLGTVTGMISVFDVMANQGSNDPKLMAAGISLATIPTMAGMVAALTGMIIHSRLSKRCLSAETALEKSLRNHQ